MYLSETSRSTTTRILYPPISPFKFLLNFPNSFFFSRVTLRPIISLGIITRRGSKWPSFPSKRDPLTPVSSRPSQKNPVDRRNRPSRASIVLSQFRRVFFFFSFRIFEPSPISHWQLFFRLALQPRIHWLIVKLTSRGEEDVVGRWILFSCNWYASRCCSWRKRKNNKVVNLRNNFVHFERLLSAFEGV